MRFIILLFLYTLSSCAYPDIDTVPNFQNLNITEQEHIDLCKLSNDDNKKFIECLVEYYEKELKNE